MRKLFANGIAYLSSYWDVDSRVLWKKSVSELTAKSDFEYSSVRYKGYLNLDKRMESLSGNLDSSGVLDNPLSDNFLDSSDWDVTEGLSVFKGVGRHISNELESKGVILDDEDLLDDMDEEDCFSYGGYRYNDLFFEEELDDDSDSDDSLDNKSFFNDDDDLDEDLEEDLEDDDEDLQDEEVSYILSSVSNSIFVKDVSFLFLEGVINNLSDSELKALIKKELKY